MTALPLPITMPVPRLAAEPRRTGRAVYRRRRVSAVLLLLVIVLAARALVLDLSGAAPVPPARDSLPIAVETYRVQPGDTLWGIARHLQPRGDVRALVDELSRAEGGRPIHPGELIAVP